MNTPSSPEWLQKLEQESWQAELVVSGLMLLGSLQLPDYVLKLVDYLVDILPMEQYLVGYGIAFMLLLGVCILSTFFIVHLVLRAYWIGLIGLNSVFPNGYGEGGFFPKAFTKRFTALLPKVSDTIKKVDDICSSIFASAFAFLMMYGMAAIIGALLLWLYNLTADYLPDTLRKIIFLAPFGVFLLYILVSIIANLKMFKENQTVQDWFFKLGKFNSYMMTTVFFRPVNQILYTYYSNYKKDTSGTLLSLSFILIAVGLTTSYVGNTNIVTLVQKGIDQNMYFQPDKLYHDYYTDHHTGKKAVFTPSIPSQRISDDLLKIFIPVLSNESAIQKSICPPYQPVDSLSSLENRRRKSLQMLPCYVRYHRVFVNDQLQQPQFQKYYAPTNDVSGIVTYLPTDSLPAGLNRLKIQKLKDKQGAIYEEWVIPFWFSPPR